MSDSIPWNSQPLESWAQRHAPGTFVDLEGLSTHYVKMGAGAPVIVLHGFFFDSQMWSKNLDALAQEYTVYALDLWGFGFSTRKPLDYGYPLYTRQVRAFMDALQIERAHLIGQSMGGGTIMNFTISDRERVDKIVLVDAAGMPNPLPIMGRISNLPLLGEMMYSLKGNFMHRFVLGNNFVYNKHLLTDEFFDQLMGFHKIKGSTEVMLSVTRRMFFDTLSEEIKQLGTLDVPTLIVWGKNETSIRLSIGQELHARLPGSQFVALDEAGHCSNIDQAEEFNRLALAFLRDGTVDS